MRAYLTSFGLSSTMAGVIDLLAQAHRDCRSFPVQLERQTRLAVTAPAGIGQAIASAWHQAGADIAVAARKLETWTGRAVDPAKRRRKGGGDRDGCLETGSLRRRRRRSSCGAWRARYPGEQCRVEEVCRSLDVDEALWDRILDTNLKGAFFCAQAAAKAMQQEGRIDPKSLLVDVGSGRTDGRALWLVVEKRSSRHDSGPGGGMGAARHSGQ